MKIRTYHGWILIEKQTGFKDHFSVQWFDAEGRKFHKEFGYGKAADSVYHFEVKLNLGNVMLESTPMGIRVYTEVDEKKVLILPPGFCHDCGSPWRNRHTGLCEMAGEDAIRDLGNQPGTQYWDGEPPNPVFHLVFDVEAREFIALKRTAQAATKCVIDAATTEGDFQIFECQAEN